MLYTGSVKRLQFIYVQYIWLSRKIRTCSMNYITKHEHEKMQILINNWLHILKDNVNSYTYTVISHMHERKRSVFESRHSCNGPFKKNTLFKSPSAHKAIENNPSLMWLCCSKKPTIEQSSPKTTTA